MFEKEKKKDPPILLPITLVLLAVALSFIGYLALFYGDNPGFVGFLMLCFAMISGGLALEVFTLLRQRKQPD